MAVDKRTMGILERVADVGIVKPAAHLAQRVNVAAEQQTAAARAAATAALLNSTLLAFTAAVYTPAPGDTHPAGIDAQDWRLLLPAPWGNNYARWGLRRTEALILREYLKAWQLRPRLAPLFVFNWDTLRWHADLNAYPTFREAGAIVKEVVPAVAVVDLGGKLRAKQRARNARTASNAPTNTGQTPGHGGQFSR